MPSLTSWMLFWDTASIVQYNVISSKYHLLWSAPASLITWYHHNMKLTLRYIKVVMVLSSLWASSNADLHHSRLICFIKKQQQQKNSYNLQQHAQVSVVIILTTCIIPLDIKPQLGVKFLYGLIQKVTAPDSRRWPKWCLPKAVAASPIFVALLGTALMSNHLLGDSVK